DARSGIARRRENLLLFALAGSCSVSDAPAQGLMNLGSAAAFALNDREKEGDSGEPGDPTGDDAVRTLNLDNFDGERDMDCRIVSIETKPCIGLV
ncbi:hypothetical protein B0A49_10927, partial [Cryomyces minteri]